MKPNLLAVCHDAGGAEVVSSWVRRHLDEWEAEYLLAGPAVEIFDRKLPKRSRVVGKTPDFVLCGSSVPSAWERVAIAVAKSIGIRSAVYLDHWKNYRDRFRPEAMPEEIWVCDYYAEAIALGDFPEMPVVFKGNPYLEDFENEFFLQAPQPRDEVERILWIDEPGRRREFRHYVRTLHDAFVLVRPHPATPRGSYDSLLGAHTAAYDAAVANPEDSLAKNVAWADTVAGCDSMALVAALSVGKRVVSAISDNESSIPYPEIERPFA